MVDTECFTNLALAGLNSQSSVWMLQNWGVLELNDNMTTARDAADLAHKVPLWLQEFKTPRSKVAAHQVCLQQQVRS